MILNNICLNPNHVILNTILVNIINTITIEKYDLNKRIYRIYNKSHKMSSKLPFNQQIYSKLLKTQYSCSKHSVLEKKVKKLTREVDIIKDDLDIYKTFTLLGVAVGLTAFVKYMWIS